MELSCIHPNNYTNYRLWTTNEQTITGQFVVRAEFIETSDH